MAKAVHDGHRQRLKARFLAEGIDSFQPHEILELILFYGVPRVDTNEIAHHLIERFGSLAEVMDAPYEELLQVKGVTESAAALLKLLPQAARIYLTERHGGQEILNTPAKLGEYFVNRFVGETSELVYLLCLDSSLNAISCTKITEGGVSGATVAIREIVSLALRHNSAWVVLAHNHPRGLAAPSNEDVIATRTIKKALAYLGVTLVDHIIVSGKEYCSIQERYPEL